MVTVKRKITSEGAGVSPQQRSSYRRITDAADGKVPAPAVEWPIEAIKKLCPLEWNGEDGGTGLVQSMDEKAYLCLSVGWEKYPGEEGLIKKCLEYLDPEEKGRYANCDKDTFDGKAAEKTLRKDKHIYDIYEFTPKGEAYHCGDEDGASIDTESSSKGGGSWSVNYRCKNTLTKEEAFKKLESVFNGDFCDYPDGYCNFGQTPFSGQLGSTDSEDSGIDSEAKEQKPPPSRLKVLKEHVLTILDKANFVALASWSGNCEDTAGDHSALLEREEFFFFRTEDGQKFLFQFGWEYYCG